MALAGRGHASPGRRPCGRRVGLCFPSPARGTTGITRLDGDGEYPHRNAVAPLTAAHPGKTGVHLLPLGTDAFAARMALTQAARRGVRVRILLDDQTSRDNQDIV